MRTCGEGACFRWPRSGPSNKPWELTGYSVLAGFRTASQSSGSKLPRHGGRWTELSALGQLRAPTGINPLVTRIKGGLIYLLDSSSAPLSILLLLFVLPALGRLGGLYDAAGLTVADFLAAGFASGLAAGTAGFFAADFAVGFDAATGGFPTFEVAALEATANVAIGCTVSSTPIAVINFLIVSNRVFAPDFSTL
ncbi:hypothetical protein SAMN03159473_01790 [Pseudomonas sp. NFACC52]|nr:hypothetical protein SAMN03159481_02515 [Pseudomonas sp. NFACC56-3]SFK39209.1 hypothetical protein SAMN03159473_01790 [Pseudomonas sp. NFACC52]